MVQKIILRLKKSIWLYPAFIGLLSLSFAIIIGQLDINSSIELYTNVPSVFLTSVELSKTILGTIAGSLITMTTFTFSTTMVVLTTYSSQFSPRTVENFLSDDDTMKALGVFVGGFIYSIIVLLFMKNSLEDKLVISASLGIIYAIICLIYFVRYIQHVGSFIQTNNLIRRLHDLSDKRIDDYLEFLEDKEIIHSLSLSSDFIVKIQSKDYGYIQLIDYSKINKVAESIQGKVFIDKVHGQYLSTGSTLFTIEFKENIQINQDDIESLLSAITIGDKKSDIQDFNFSIQKIVEIGLRAISPGINDPNTCIHCLRILGILLGKLSHIEGLYALYKKEDENYPRVYYELIDFKEELIDTYIQIINYGKSDLTVINSIIKSLYFIGEQASRKNKDKIKELLEYIWIKIDGDNLKSMELHILKKEKENLLELLTK